MRRKNNWLALALAIMLMGSNMLENQVVYAASSNEAKVGTNENSNLEKSEEGQTSENNPNLENGQEEDNQGSNSQQEADADKKEDTTISKETSAEDDQNALIKAQDEETQDEPQVAVPSVSYQTHVQSYGWMNEVKDGAFAGTTGKAKRMEGIKISLSNLAGLEGSGITYQTYVQTYGWRDEVKDGAVAGTTGQAKRVEAIKINLTGVIAEQYDVYYRVYVQTYGWLGWTSNGQTAGTLDYAKRLEGIEIKLIGKGQAAPEPTTDFNKIPQIRYEAYSQSVGWQGVRHDNDVAGVTGRAKRLEALKISYVDSDYSGTISYRAYVQKEGWQSWKSDGQTAGTTNQSKRIEALEIKLDGELAEHYDIYYSVHMAKIGWTNYAKNGETIGTTGLSKRVEAVKVMLVDKDTQGPSTSGTKYIESYGTTNMFYSAQIKGGAATGNINQGGTLGVTGQGKQLQNFNVSLNKTSDNMPSGNINYMSHVSGTGWTGWSSNGAVNGSQDAAHGLEAVEITLSGDIAKYYDVYYRAHIQKYGWMGWAKNGQPAGSSKIGYRMEALQVQLVSKDAGAPGSMSSYYTESPKPQYSGTQQDMLNRANGYSSNTRFLILVDRNAHKVGIFTGANGNRMYMQYWDCANGKASTPTKSGVFTVGSRGYYFDSGNARCYWYTQFYGNYLFHSVLYNKYTGNLADGRVGMALSHGCVRLRIENAKWIYDNIPRGTKVVVY